jgi:hypothetical protein
LYAFQFFNNFGHQLNIKTTHRASRLFSAAISTLHFKYHQIKSNQSTIMKKTVFFLFSLITISFLTSCKKDDAKPETPKTQVPDAFVGKWEVGNFNMSNFFTYDGSSPYIAGNDAVAYSISKDGNAEQFIYYQFDDGSKKQVLAHRKGTVTYDENTKTLKFCPKEGSFRTFINRNKTEDTYGNEDLYPKYAPQYRNCYFETDNQRTYLIGTSDRNETLAFRKVNW